MMKNFSVCIVSLLTVFILISCKEVKKEQLPHDETRFNALNDSLELKQEVHALLVSVVGTDSTDYFSSFKKDTIRFIEFLVENIDKDEKRFYYDSNSNLSKESATLPVLKNYIGLRAICYLNFLMDTRYDEGDDEIKDDFCSFCVSNFLRQDKEALTLDDLRNIKKIYNEWLATSKGLSWEKRRNLWLKDYKIQIISFI